MGKQHKAVMYTLTLLETIVKNGQPHVHSQIMRKDFIQVRCVGSALIQCELLQQLVVIIGPKYDPPQVVQEKVLGMIQVSAFAALLLPFLTHCQMWADAFRGMPSCAGVCEVYDELKTKGVEFPMQDLDTMAPILTPQRTVQPQAQVLFSTLFL